jgi:hypothetical protein
VQKERVRAERERSARKLDVGSGIEKIGVVASGGRYAQPRPQKWVVRGERERMAALSKQ